MRIYHTKKQDLYFNKVVHLYYKKHLGAQQISKILPLDSDTILRWIRIFAAENPTFQSPMKRKKTPLREEKPVVPTVEVIESTDVKALQAEIARLKAELKTETLRATVYNEMINVAEKQFNISIRKKAGTK